MIVSDFAVNRSTTIFVLTILIIVAGVITVQDLSVGESEEYRAEFTMQNPRVTSSPVAEITDHSYDW